MSALMESIPASIFSSCSEEIKMRLKVNYKEIHPKRRYKIAQKEKFMQPKK